MSKTLDLYDMLRNELSDSEDGRLPSRTTLAENFGVSPATVSNAIRRLKDEGHIRTIPGKGAFLLRPGAKTEKGLLVGVAGSYLPDAGPLERDAFGAMGSNIVLQGIRQAAQRSACTIAALPWNDGRLDMASIRSLKLDGLILAGGMPREELVKAARCGIPALLANYPATVAPSLPFLDFDNAWAIAESIRLFKERGLRRIAFICLSSHSVPGYERWIKERFILALANAGLPFEPELCVQTSYSGETRALSISDEESVFFKSKRPDAILYWDQGIFRDARRLFEKLGAEKLLKLPALAACCGADSGSCSGFVQNGEELGRALFEALAKRIADPFAEVSGFIKPVFKDYGTL